MQNILYKELCLQRINKPPPTHILDFIRPNNVVHIKLDSVVAQDMEFLELLLCISFAQIQITNRNTKIEPNVIFKFLNLNLQQSKILRIITFSNIQLTPQSVTLISKGLSNAKHLKELHIVNCNLTSQHLQSLTNCLIKNQSLVALDLSNNSIREIAHTVGKVLAEHTTRRNQVMWQCTLKDYIPDDLLNAGIYEVNLQNNLIDDQAIIDFVKVFKFDNWTRSLNLQNNRIEKQGVKEFVALMETNTTLITLDLRSNPGFDKEDSKIIFKRLVRNMEKFKKQKEKYKKSLQQAPKRKEHNSYFVDSKKNPKPEMNNMTICNQNNSFKCQHCKTMQISMLQMQKKNLDLIIQNHKLKSCLLPRNLQVSAINPRPQLEQISFNVRNLQNQTSEDLIQKMEYIMLELTKILQNIENQHQTQGNISNPLSVTANNLSHTVQILANHSETSVRENPLEEISNIQ